MAKVNKKVLLGAAAVASLMATSGPAHATTAPVPVNVDIIDAIAVASVRALDFGTITRGTGGTVNVTNASVRTNPTGTVGLVTGGGEQSGQFSVTAANTVTYDITLPALPVNLGAVGLDLTALTIDGGAPAANYTGNGAAQTYNLGGTITVPAAVASGAYTTNITLTAQYE